MQKNKLTKQICSKYHVLCLYGEFLTFQMFQLERGFLHRVSQSVLSLVMRAVRYFCSVTSAVSSLIPVRCLHTGNTFNTVQWNGCGHTYGESLPGPERFDKRCLVTSKKGYFLLFVTHLSDYSMSTKGIEDICFIRSYLVSLKFGTASTRYHIKRPNLVPETVHMQISLLVT